VLQVALAPLPDCRSGLLSGGRAGLPLAES